MKGLKTSGVQAPLDHLSPETHVIANADDATRINYIRRDRFIEHAGIRPHKDRLLSLLGRPRTVRPQCVLLASEAGSGKTALLRHIQRLYPDREDRGSGRIIRSVVYFEVEPAPTLWGLKSGLLTELGAPPLNLRHGEARNDLIKRYLSEFDTETVLFDEVQHLLVLPRRQRMLQLDWMKWISTAGKASVVLSAAMSDGRRLIEHDAQLLTRFTEISIPRFVQGIVFGQFLLTLERSLPLRLRSGLAQEAVQRAILDKTQAMQTLRGLTDGVVKVVQEAAVAAVTTGAERIDLPLLSAWRQHTRLEVKQPAGALVACATM